MQKILLVNNHTKDWNELKTLLKNYDFSACTKEEFSSDLAKKFDTIIFSGGSNVRSVKSHSEDYKTEIEFIQNTDKKIIGICLGCEIVAVAFGCSLKNLDSDKKGITDINFENSKIPIYEHHRFIIDTVSDDIEPLAKSVHGIEMIKHKSKPIFGLQFHPEMFVDKTEGYKIFMNILQGI